MSLNHVEILIYARHLIACKHQGFTCNAVRKADEVFSAYSEESSQILNRISELLYPHLTLDTWLMCKEHATARELDDTPEKLRRTRLIWIDDMIEYWSDK